MTLKSHYDESNKVWTLHSGDRMVLEYIYGDDLDPNPSFRRVVTMGGHELTLYRPWDHPWHLGLFFAWKYINGLNFWESWYHGQRNVAVTHSFAPLPGDQTETGFVQALDYVTHNGKVLLHEVRSVKVLEVGTDGYAIHWTGRFLAKDKEAPIKLDRTQVTPKSPWGGYAGLSFRFARNMLNPIITTDIGVYQAEEAHNRSFAWCDYTGKVDGYTEPQFAGITILSDPRNIRHPSPMLTYDYKDMQLLQAAFLQNEEYVLQPEEMLTLRYTIYVHDGNVDPAQIARLNDMYMNP